MHEEWIEVLVETDLDGAELLGWLDDADASGGWQEAGLVRLYWPAGRWREETRARLEAVLRELGARSPALAVRSVPLQDWNATWARSVQPLRIGRRLLIRPSWEAADHADDLVELILDPKQAFGTGHHPTTRLLLEWLEELYAVQQGGRHVLDIGTGSGILAMAALKLGARSAIGVDIDATAIACAQEAAEANGFGPELRLHVASLSEVERLSTLGRPDLVLGNLDRRTILGAAGQLVRLAAPAARLLLSGLLTEDLADVAQAFTAAGLAVRRTRESEGWLALELVSVEGCEGGDGNHA